MDCSVSPSNLNSENMEDLVQESRKALINYLCVLSEKQEVESWNEVFESILHKDHHLALLKDENLIDAVVGHLLDMLLLPPGCPSKDTVSRILEAFCRCGFESRTFGNSEAMFHRLRTALLKRKEFSTPAPVNFWSLVSDGHSSLMEEFILRARCAILLGRDLSLLRILVAYGVDLRMGMVAPDFGFQLGFRAVSKLCDTHKLLHYAPRSELSEILRTLRKNRGRTSSKNQRGFARISLIVQSLFALGRLPDNDRGTCVRTLEAYWDTIADPLVSEEEVREFLLLVIENDYLYRRTETLEKVLTDPILSEKEVREFLLSLIEDDRRRITEAVGEMVSNPLVSEKEVREFLLLLIKGDVDRRRDAVEQLVDKFVCVFGRRAYEPRRLSHLCRCTVRRTIVLNAPVTLPAAVELLHLPSALKRFILCNPERLSEQ